MHDFSISEAMRFGWKAMKSNFWFFAGITLVSILIVFIPTFIINIIVEKGSQTQSITTSFVISFVKFLFQLVSMIISMGFIKIALKIYDNEKTGFADFFSCFPLFFKYLFGGILYSLIVTGGLFLFVIPGVFWMVKFYFFGYAIIDKGMGPIEALKESSVLTKGVKWDLLALIILVALINIIGALPIGLGLFVAIPTTKMAMAFVYRKLLSQSGIPQAAQVPNAPVGVGVVRTNTNQQQPVPGTNQQQPVPGTNQQ